MKKQFTELIGVCFTLVLLLIGTSGVQAQYCDVDDGGNTTDDWLAGVEFAGIDNESGSTVYTDYTDISGVVVPGQSYPFTATVGNNATWNQFVTVFIDWNGDEEWNNEDERYDIGNCAFNGCTVTDDILVPAGLPSGEVRMRVIENYNVFVSDACSPGTFSEVEDYSIIIEGDGSCQLPIFAYDIVDDCENFTYGVTATLTDFNDNLFITVSMVRSDAVEVDDVTLPFAIEGQTVTLIEDVPVGVTVDATISAGPDCFTTRSWINGLCPPPNDICADAIAMECGVPYFGDLEGADQDETCNFANLRNGAWYTLTFDAPHFVELESCFEGTNHDTDLSVFTGDDCDNLTCFTGFSGDGYIDGVSGCSFAGFAAGGPDAVFFAEPGVTYYILISSFSTVNTTWDYELLATCTEILCTDPTVEAVAVDADGNEIVDCISASDEVRVEVTLSDGSGNDTYTVTVGDSTKTMVSPETHIFGTYSPGATINVTVDGDDDPLCGASASVSTEVCPPENDDCADAIALECGVPVFGSTIGATVDARCPTNLERFGVWYTLTLDGPNVVQLETCFEGTNYDTDISVLTGPDCDNLSCFAGFSGDGYIDGVSGCSFAGFAAGGPDAVFNAEGGVTYYILVTGFSTSPTAQGTFELLATCEAILCETPELTVSVVDGEGNSFDGCQEPGTEFFVNVAIAGGSGNATYTASATANFSTVSETIDADGSTQFGPYVAGANVDISVLGDDDMNCEVFGSATLDVCPPPNDLCSEALPLPCNGSYIGNTVGGTDDNTCGFGSPLRRGVWFVYSPDSDVQVSMETCFAGTNFDTDLSVFSGADCENLECFTGFSGDGYIDGVSGCSFAGFAAGGPDATFTAAAGETYYILLSGFGTASFGDYELHVTCQDLECSPTVAATAVADAEGNPLEDCLPDDGEYWVSVELTEGSESIDYQISVNGVDAGAPVMTNSTTVVGPVAALSTANILVVGVGEGNETCSGDASTSVSDICPPANDVPCLAYDLPVDGVGVPGTNLNSGLDEGEPTVVFNGINTVWYSFVAPASGRVNITTCSENTNFDTGLGLFSVVDCGDYSTYTLLASNDDDFTCTGNQSTVEACVEPGETYYVQVSGWNSNTGQFELTATEVDGAVCSCVLPDFDPFSFIVASTAPFCDDPETPGYTVTFFTPEDLGTSEFMVFTYTVDGVDYTLELEGGAAFTIEQIIPAGTTFNFNVDISDPNCVGADGSVFPANGLGVAQPTDACDPDCEGVPGGPAQPGTPCTTEDDGPGVWDENCECQAAPDNDTCDLATPIACGDILTEQTNNFASVNTGCNNVDRPTVWYVYEATENAIVDLSTCEEGTGFDTDISMYTGPSCDELTCFPGWGGNGYIDGASSCPFAGFASAGTFEAVAGETYYIAVSSFSATITGDFTIAMTCELLDEASLSGTAANACGERDVTLSFYEVGTDNMAFSYTTDMVDGSYSVDGVEPGTWDIIVKVDGALANGFSSVEIATGANVLELGTVVLGDINNDNVVNILDVSLLNGSFGAGDGDPNYNALADMNCDGGVNIVDVSFVNAGFGQSGDTAPIIE